VEIKDTQERVKLYQEKKAKSREKFSIVEKVEYHPELIDIELFDFFETGFPKQLDDEKTNLKNYDSIVAKYIPLLLYDDLQECMLQNIVILEKNEAPLLNPSYLLESNVILLLESEGVEYSDLSNCIWLNDLTEVDLEGIINSIVQSLISESNTKDKVL
jgi:hypothetical protein